MSTAQHYEFEIDKANNTIYIVREFDGSLEIVWDSWTKPEYLDLWWGPKTWHAETIEMDFRDGGYWFYAMVSPENQRHYGKTNFIAVEPQKYFASKGGFADDKGIINTQMPQNVWENTFTAVDSKTRIQMRLIYDTFDDLEAELAMGFKEGISLCMEQLDEILEQNRIK